MFGRDAESRLAFPPPLRAAFAKTRDARTTEGQRPPWAGRALAGGFGPRPVLIPLWRWAKGDGPSRDAQGPGRRKSFPHSGQAAHATGTFSAPSWFGQATSGRCSCPAGPATCPALQATVARVQPGVRIGTGDMPGRVGTGPTPKARRRFGQGAMPALAVPLRHLHCRRGLHERGSDDSGSRL